MQTLFIRKFLTIYAVLSILGGCGSIPKAPAKWRHPTNDQTAIKRDHYQCIEKVWKLYPEKRGLVSDGTGYWEYEQNASSSCRYNKYAGTTNCTYTPAKEKRYISGSIIEGDQNAEIRVTKYAICMNAKDAAYRCMRNNELVEGVWCAKYSE